MKKTGHRISRVLPGSIAEELEIEAGDRILAIDNTNIEDIFDYQFIMANFKEMMKQVALVAGISPNDCEVKVLDILGNCA